ncbi:unnamed protein product [Bursaphelenchus xylophilus]|uniref:(pine wood nematode) hypothetical protein n=1 Tax=Bursaphelenchus xylophilus TaxID=6326 RepID=A0A1I7RSE8_BURXY|nr:unnamed protein product [Bursaphelenchus xylophilus]CAG9123004.1 unnamed protein product [Bursaphelenchus xylophilus]
MSREWADLQVSRALNRVENILGQLSLNESEVRRQRKYRTENIKMARQELRAFNPPPSMRNKSPALQKNPIQSTKIPVHSSHISVDLPKQPIQMGNESFLGRKNVNQPGPTRNSSESASGVASKGSADKNALNYTLAQTESVVKEIPGLSSATSTFRCRSKSERVAKNIGDAVYFGFPPIEVEDKNGNFEITLSLQVNDDKNRRREYHITCKMTQGREITEARVDDVTFVKNI